MKDKTLWREMILVAISFVAWTSVIAHPDDAHDGVSRTAVQSMAEGSKHMIALDEAQVLGAVIERALARYFETRGIEFSPGGELAGLIADEMAGRGKSEGQALPNAERGYKSSRRLSPNDAATRGVFFEDAELTLSETGSGPGDKVQLVFRTPEFDGDPTFGDAWSIVVDAEDTASADDGTMFFSTPSFSDALQLFTDGSARIPELRDLTLRRRSSPPFSCTSLQEGSFYWDDGPSTLCVCDGSSWSPLDSDNQGTCN